MRPASAGIAALSLIALLQRRADIKTEFTCAKLITVFRETPPGPGLKEVRQCSFGKTVTLPN